MKKRTVCLVLLIVCSVAPALFLVLTSKPLAGFEGLHPGDILPQANLSGSEGTPIDTGSWRGTPTVLVVFHPKCNACRVEIENLAAVAPLFPAVRVVLLSTQIEPGRHPGPFPTLLDPDGTFLRQVRRVVTPTVYWIDATGFVRHVHIGPRSAREEESLFREQLGDDGGR
jgi:peroxiredoxin